MDTMNLKITVIEPSATILSSLNGMLERLEVAGRTCYRSEDRITTTSADRFVRSICRNQHESVLEHASVTVRIICSRSCSHQLVRHRIAAYSQESMRYCNYGKLGFQVICPPKIGVPTGEYEVEWVNGQIAFLRYGLTVLQHRWLRTVAIAYNEYLQELNEGIKPEDAREVLPNATKTEIVATMNLRMWRHVFRERALNPRAQWQIRNLMAGVLKELQNKLPAVFDDL